MPGGTAPFYGPCNRFYFRHIDSKIGPEVYHRVLSCMQIYLAMISVLMSDFYMYLNHHRLNRTYRVFIFFHFAVDTMILGEVGSCINQLYELHYR